MAYQKPVLGLSTIRSASFAGIVRDYETALVGTGYSSHTVRFHLHSVAHFGVWLERKGGELGSIDEAVVAAFDQHRRGCGCPGTSRDVGPGVVSCVRAFLCYLRKQGQVPAASSPPGPSLLAGGFLRWMTAHRGAAETTVASYRLYVTNLVDFLGADPQRYTAGGLRDFIAERYRHYGRHSIRMVLAAVRMFLRYLAEEGRCRPGLDRALTAPPNWPWQSLPQGLASDQVQRVLAMCPSTSRGLRDRAVLLLLIRLGLRAGDVAGLRFTDLRLDTGTINVSGKGRREVQLPLPQDVGDALLEYLRAGRPQVDSDYVFLRSMAPLRPFATCRGGHAISHMARTALRRAGIEVPRRGAHVFRHTAACQMLRADVGLEDIAAVLRHRSIDTTAIYAKVDVHLLERVAQPWPEETSC